MPFRLWPADQPVLDKDGNPDSGATIGFFDPGTSTEKDTFSDSGLTTINPNPVLVTASGLPDNSGTQIDVWGEGKFKAVVSLSDGTTRTYDPLVNVGLSGVTSATKIIGASDSLLSVTKASLTDGEIRYAFGRDAAADTGGGFFKWDASSTTTADSGTVFASNEGGNGRWIRIFLGAYHAAWFGTVGSGDVSAAAQLGIDALEALGGGTLEFDAQDYTFNTGLVINSQGVRLVGQSRGGRDGSTEGTKFLAGASSMTIVTAAASYTGVENVFFDGNGQTSVEGLFVGPENRTQTSTLVDNSYGVFRQLRFEDLDEAIQLQCGPDVSGTNSSCWYNAFSMIEILNCDRGILLRDPPNAAGASPNRNTFEIIRIGSTGGGRGNTGVQIDAGDTNKFISVDFENIQIGTSPNATPTAIKIGSVGAVNGADIATNRFFGCTGEANTRDIENANVRTEFYGCDFEESKSLFTANPVNYLSQDSSQMAQRLHGYEFTNVSGATQTNALKLTTGRLAFPATQNPVTNANTLDDYEEGSWTPTVTASTPGTPTYSLQDGWYYKLGRHVSFSGTVTLSGGTLPSSTFVAVGGLPFVADNGDSSHRNAVSLAYENLTGGTTGRLPRALINDGASVVKIVEFDHDGEPVANSMNGSRLTSTTSFNVSGEYRTTE